VTLRDDITNRSNVELVRREGRFKRTGQQHRLPHQLLLVGLIQLMYLRDILPVRYQDEPGIVGIQHQQQVTQLQPPQNQAVIP